MCIKASIYQLHSSGFEMAPEKPQTFMCGLTDQNSGRVQHRGEVTVALGKISKNHYDCPIIFKVLRNAEAIISHI